MTLQETLNHQAILTSQYARGEISEVPPIFQYNIWKFKPYVPSSSSLELFCHICGGVIQNRLLAVKKATCRDCKKGQRVFNAIQQRKRMQIPEKETLSDKCRECVRRIRPSNLGYCSLCTIKVFGSWRKRVH